MIHLAARRGVAWATQAGQRRAGAVQQHPWTAGSSQEAHGQPQARRKTDSPEFRLKRLAARVSLVWLSPGACWGCQGQLGALQVKAEAARAAEGAQRDSQTCARPGFTETAGRARLAQSGAVPAAAWRSPGFLFTLE